jgi:hypothetical protein
MGDSFGGFASAGLIPCAPPSESGISTPSASGSAEAALSDATSPSGPSTTTGSTSSCRRFDVSGAAFFAVALGVALV